MKFKRTEDVVEARKKDQMEADYCKMKADLDYLAMMGDIDLDLDESEEEGDEDDE